MDRFLAGRFAPVLVLIALSGSIFFLNLGSARLWDRDEPRNAGCAAEMLERGDWVTPIFNDQLRHQKPALLYWLIMSAYGLFGVNEFAARFWSALLGVGTVLLTWAMGVRLFGRATGFWSGLILATMLMFGVASRAATPDAPLIFFMTAGLCCFVMLSFRPADSTEEEASFGGFPQETWKVIAINALLGFAVLAKGPIGWVLPMGIMGLYLLLSNHQPLAAANSESPGRVRRGVQWLWRVFGVPNFWRALNELRWVTGLLVALAIALPWYLWVGYRTEGEFLRRFFLEEHVGRATTSFENHSGGWWFYPLMLLVGTFPWSVFAVPVVLDTDRWVSAKRRDGSLLLLCWMGLQLALFSLVQTKLPSYITPCYPAVALLLGASLTRFAAGRHPDLELWFRRGVRTLPIIGGLIAVALVIVARKYVAGHWELVLIALPLLAGIGLAIGQMATRRGEVLVGVAIASSLFCGLLFGWGTVVVDSTRQTEPLFARIRTGDSETHIAAYKCLESSWVFYGQRPFIELQDAATEAKEFHKPTAWSPTPRLAPEEYTQLFNGGLIVTTREHLAELQPRLPSSYVVLEECDYFLKDERLVLVGPEMGEKREPLIVANEDEMEEVTTNQR